MTQMMFYPQQMPNLTPLYNAMSSAFERVLFTAQQQGTTPDLCNQAKQDFQNEMPRIAQHLLATCGGAPTVEQVHHYAMCWLQQWIQQQHFAVNQLMMQQQRGINPGGGYGYVQDNRPVGSRFDGRGNPVQVNQYNEPVYPVSTPVNPNAAYQQQEEITPAQMYRNSRRPRQQDSGYNPPADNCFLPPQAPQDGGIRVQTLPKDYQHPQQPEPQQAAPKAKGFQGPVPAIFQSGQQKPIPDKEFSMSNEKPVMMIKPENLHATFGIPQVFDVTTVAEFQGETAKAHYTNITSPEAWTNETVLMNHLRKVPFIKAGGERFATLEYSRLIPFEVPYADMKSTIEALTSIINSNQYLKALQIVCGTEPQTEGMKDNAIAAIRQYFMARINPMLGAILRVNDTTIVLDEMSELNELISNPELVPDIQSNTNFLEVMATIGVDLFRDLLPDMYSDAIPRSDETRTNLLDPSSPSDAAAIARSELVVIDPPYMIWDLPTVGEDRKEAMIDKVKKAGCVFQVRRMILVTTSEEISSIIDRLTLARMSSEMAVPSMVADAFLSEMLNVMYDKSPHDVLLSSGILLLPNGYRTFNFGRDMKNPAMWHITIN